MDAWSLLTDATIRAVFLIARDRGIDLAGKDAEMAESLKSVVKERIPAVQDEWKGALEARVGDHWLKELVNAQANELAISVLKRMGGDMIDDMIFDDGFDEFDTLSYRCLLCDCIFAENEIDDHLVEDHFELLEDFGMAIKAGRHWEFSIDASALPFVELY